MSKYRQYVLSFRHKARVCRTDGQTDGQTDGRTELRSRDRARIATSRGKKGSVLHFRTGDFPEFRQILSKINILVISSAFFVKNEILWSLTTRDVTDATILG